MSLLKQGNSQVTAAVKAGMSERTARTYARSGRAPSAVKVEHTWRTRPDPFAGLLEDETCWFLAVDFDKHSWKKDTAAFAETCRSIGVPIAVERSRSGNGAHAWFFFAAPVSANVARRMGCFLVTETMTRRLELSMESYDRLFPNQDTMPRGGFGNLIALPLPLQHEPRRQSNSVFIDARFEPFADQWAFLASVQRIEPAAAESIARDATRTGQIIGVRFAEAIDDEEAVAPWKRLPSGLTPTKRIIRPLPSEVKVVLAQRLFIEKIGLPAPLLNHSPPQQPKTFYGV
jgi:hypothetical protein